LLGRKLAAVCGRNLQATYDLIRSPEFAAAAPRLDQGVCSVSTGQLRIMLRSEATDALIFEEVLLRQSYAPLLRVCRQLGLDIRTAIDAGANIGAFTLFIADAFPKATIISLEPEPGNFALLVQHLQANNLTGVTALNAGIWSENVSLSVNDLGLSRERELSFTVSPVSAAIGDVHVGTVEGLTLDVLLRRLGTDVVDLVKLDIEGAEAQLFRTREDVERFFAQVRLCAVEIHDEAFDRLFFTTTLHTLGIRHVQYGETLYAYPNAQG